MNKSENFIQNMKNKFRRKKQILEKEEQAEKQKIIEEIETDEDRQNTFVSSMKLLFLITMMSLVCVFGYSYHQNENGNGDIIKDEKENFLVSENFISHFSQNLRYRVSIGNAWNTIIDTQETNNQIIYYLSEYDNSFEKRTYNENTQEQVLKSNDNLLYAKYKVNDEKVEELSFSSSPKFLKYKKILIDSIRLVAENNSYKQNPNIFPTKNDINSLANEFKFYHDDGEFHSYNDIVFDKNGKVVKENGVKVKDEKEIKNINYKQDKENIQKLLKVIEKVSNKKEGDYTFTIIIPKESLNPNISIHDSLFMQYFVIKKFIEMLIVFGIGFFLVLIIALFTPITKQNKIPMVKGYNNLFIITKTLIILIVFTLILLLGFGLRYTDFQYDEYFNTFDYGEIILLKIFMANSSFYYIFTISISFFTFLFTYLIIANFKYIHYTGFVNGFVKKTIIGNIFISLNTLLKKTFVKTKNNFNKNIQKEYKKFFKNYKKKIILFLLMNSLFFIIISIFFIRDIFLMMLITFVYTIYSIFLYKYIKTFLSKLEMIQESTQNISQGQFKSDIDENIGILSQIAQNLNSISKGFKIAVEKEVKSQNMKTQLISNVSHDLKTPLTSIINYSDLLKNKDLNSEEKEEYIDIIYQKSQRLKILIEDLFEVSKASSGNIKLNIEKLDIIALLRQTLGEMEEKINENQLEMRIYLPEEKVFCNIDGLRTYRVFSNIIGNITKYTLKGTRVYISCIQDDEKVIFEFKNISNYEMDFDEKEIMQRFQRGDKSRTKEGSGLGLAIAKSLIELQGGKIQIKVDGDLFKLEAIFPKSKYISN